MRRHGGGNKHDVQTALSFPRVIIIAGAQGRFVWVTQGSTSCLVQRREGRHIIPISDSLFAC